MRLALGLFLPFFISAATLTERIDAALQGSPAAQQAFWGVQVVDLKTGQPVYSRNEDKFFVPASNTKLFSTGLALSRLGTDYRFHTTVEADAKPDADGLVSGIRLVGGGDPNLSARTMPYQHNSFGPNPLVALDSLADKLVQAGVKVVRGDVVGDDTAYAWEPYPDGWSVDDPIWEYGAPVSALTLNDNAFGIAVAPGNAVGDPGVITLSPHSEHLLIHNRTRTIVAGESKLIYDRVPGSSELIVRGVVRLKGPPVKEILAIDDPALFAASAFREALIRKGIEVQGGAAARHRLASEMTPRVAGVELARETSLPLIEALRVVNKVSQNLHAEIMLRESARAKNGIGTRQGGIAELKAFLSEIGVADKQYNFVDGSGLSRLTLVTPRTVAKLLTYLYGTPHREKWIGTLPTGGEDGTLSSRFGRAAEATNIHAKTGSLSHVSALSGYALQPGGASYVFSILVNNFNSDTASIRKVMDQIALAVLQGSGDQLAR